MNIIAIFLCLIVLGIVISVIRQIILDINNPILHKIIFSTILLVLMIALIFSITMIEHPQIIRGYPEVGQTWVLETENPFEQNIFVVVVNTKDGYVAYVYNDKYQDYLKSAYDDDNNINSMNEKSFVRTFKQFTGN